MDFSFLIHYIILLLILRLKIKIGNISRASSGRDIFGDYLKKGPVVYTLLVLKNGSSAKVIFIKKYHMRKP